ncbi:MAG: sugar-transfer associated ATP-grasp domain-containing protein [Pseudomonadota bacterium]|jgi:hypothetical protein|nr:sugar-transfer associated ATP-grasp domain-containing protein [Pseudomonadota bacterium]
MFLGISLTDLFRNTHIAKKQTGKSQLAQIKEIIRCRRGPGKVSAKEYFDYRLFELNPSQHHTFAGVWAKGVVYQAQDPQWCGIGNDKLLAYAFLKTFGLPIPVTKAVYESRRYYPGVALISTVEDMEDWLRQKDNYPFFSKPSAGAFGMGSCCGVSWNEKTDSIVTVTGEEIPVKTFALDNWNKHLGGLIFQDVIEPDPALVRLFGRRVATARIITMAAEGETRVHRAAFRIPVGKNFTDNFNLGTGGNGFAEIDIETGTLGDMYEGLGLTLRRTQTHLDTGERITGFQLPHWNEALDIVKLGQQALFGLPILGWDIAFTVNGPVVVEFNTHPGYALLQATGRGLMDDVFLQYFPMDPLENRKRYQHIIIGTGSWRRR